VTRQASEERILAALIYGVRAGFGGLGHSAASAISALARPDQDLAALGPGYHQPWSLPGGVPNARWLQSPEMIPGWKSRYTWLRWKPGEATFRKDSSLGRWAADQVQKLRPEACYGFTQVALETLRWARREGVFSALDNPNGHIRNFREICQRESLRWTGKAFAGHPTQAMVDRVAEEYDLADGIRVYSDWGRRSMSDYGVSDGKIRVVRQTINLDRFRPPAIKPPAGGPLHICYVGSLDLRKGFVYLLRAIRAAGARHFRLSIVGATGDRNCAALFRRESQGLDVQCAPGDPTRSYEAAEIFALPTLEDGLPFVLPEAMACGLPVIVTDQCGAGECVRPGADGWIVPAANEEALASALEMAIRRRGDLPEMGRSARSTIEDYCGPAQLRCLADWFYNSARHVESVTAQSKMQTG
jgi:glycosyltransferase involved in cell wall biosynthesis